jgi:Bacterial virulence protein (VirJ)
MSGRRARHLAREAFRRRRLRCGLVMLSLALSGCAANLPPSSKPFDDALSIDARQLTVHFANQGAMPGRPLLVYTTGDAGWVRKDLAVYREMVSWGYPIAGISAPDYLEHLRGKTASTPERVGDDYARIIAFAQARMHLEPGAPVVLVGVSRGAGLEVVAAGQRVVREKLGGVVAVALTKEEEHVRWPGHLPVVHRTAIPVMVELYEYLPLLGAMPVAVVQSTRDSYLPADAAARLFGPDTDTRRFRAIEARNHTFGGARREMYDALRASLEWIETLIRPRK